MYLKGKGTTQSDAKAFEWTRKAALQDLPMAQSGLAVFYEKGINVQQDKNKALEWYQKSCSNGYPFACAEYRRLYQK